MSAVAGRAAALYALDGVSAAEVAPAISGRYVQRQGPMSAAVACAQTRTAQLHPPSALDTLGGALSTRRPGMRESCGSPRELTAPRPLCACLAACFCPPPPAIRGTPPPHTGMSLSNLELTPNPPHASAPPRIAETQPLRSCLMRT